MTDQVVEAGIVIIGGGQAGGWAAKTLRDKGYTGILTVVADEPLDFYERPPLSKAVILDDSDAVSLPRLFSQDVVDGLNIQWQRPRRATQILPQEKRVQLDNGVQLQYQQLLIATGGRPRLPNPTWADLPCTVTLRSWADAQQLKQRLRTARHIAVVGGGWIGLEIAASARQLGVEVTVFERQPALCLRSVSSGVSQALLELHQSQGVQIHCDCGDIHLQADEHGRARIRTDKTPEQLFDLVVVGIGVDLNLELAREAGLAIEQGIVVDEYGQTSQPDVFAAGDVARHPQLGLCLQSWAFAQNQAMVVANNMLQPRSARYEEPAWLWSDQYQHNIQILGIPQTGTQQVTRVEGNARLFISLNPQNQLVQMVAFNDGRAIKLGKRWIAAGRVLDPAQLADPDFSLMSLK